MDTSINGPGASLPDFLPTKKKQIEEVQSIGRQQATNAAIASGKVTLINRRVGQ